MEEQSSILTLSNEISICLCGAAGQGIQTVERIVIHVLKRSGFHVFATKEYMSRVRGGVNSTTIRVSRKPVKAFKEKIDLLIPISQDAINHVKDRIRSDTFVLGDRKVFEKDLSIINQDYLIDVSFIDIADELGGKIYANTVAAGLLSGLLDANQEILQNYLTERFAEKGTDIVEKNIVAAMKGFDIGRELSKSGKLVINIPRHPEISEEVLLDGTQAVALGAIAGGVNFIAFYPMSPSTGVPTFLAQQAHKFGIIVDQTEDEISAINKALGAWYAGARAMLSTSGGGLALMEEGLSLAGIIESPLVIHLGQRVAPATGMPTRTEQGDLELVLYAGHGDFPRVLLSPGTIEDSFYLTHYAFNLADKYQVPVFILTDHYLIDTYYNIPAPDLLPLKVEKHITKTKSEYIRFQFTENGISPRGIPGYGKGLVAVDSHVHTEEGHYTENFSIRRKMIDKRMKKLELLEQESIAPELLGPSDYSTLIIGWGSTYHVINEARLHLNREDVAFLHFKQVYPLHKTIIDFLKRATKLIIVENNATSQFGNLIKLKTGIHIHSRILKYNGLAFSVEELVERLNKEIE
ncbi:MAG: 2-oxoacid:acceptor oxidoreductase subunit alpha [Candidatus Hodarchaeota archaeon]